MSSLLNNTTEAQRWWLALGVVLAKAYFQKKTKQGYSVSVYHENSEIQGILQEAFGGKVSRGKGGKGYWYISGQEKVEALLELLQPYITQSQWRHWLVSIGKISKSSCSGCGAPTGAQHESECYLAS